jgi:hypothetical protein
MKRSDTRHRNFLFLATSMPPLQLRLDPLKHLIGRLVGEGHRQDAIGPGSMSDQVRHTECDHARLPRPGTSQHQEGPGESLDSFGLSRVQ